MATHSLSQLDVDSEVPLVDNQQKTRGQEFPPTTLPPTNFFPSSALAAFADPIIDYNSVPTFNVKDERRNISSSVPAQNYSTSFRDIDSIDTRIATHPSAELMCQVFRHVAINEMIEAPREQPLMLQLVTQRASTGYNDDMHGRSFANLEVPIEMELLNSPAYSRHRLDNSAFDLESNPCFHIPPNTLQTIDSDQQSTSSKESQVMNEYNLMAKVKGLERAKELLTSFDTQSDDDVVFRSALQDLGNVTEFSIPPKRQIIIRSPLDSSKLVRLEKFVRLRLSFYQINFEIEAELKIVEVLGELNGFQVILGRKFLRNYRLENGRNLLLEQVVMTNLQGPKVWTRSFGPFLRMAKRTKEQRKVEEAEAKAVQEKQREVHAKLYPKDESATASSRTQSTNNSNGKKKDTQGGNHSVDYSSALTYRPITYLPDSYRQPYAQQSSRQRTAQLPYTLDLQKQRRDTSSSQSTQSTTQTDYSFGRAGTWDSVSSISSWAGTTACPTKDGSSVSQPEAQQKKFPRWIEDE